MATLKRQRADGTYEYIEVYTRFVKLQELYVFDADNVASIPIYNSFSKVSDMINVYYEGYKLTENVNYSISLDHKFILLKDKAVKTGEKIEIEIFKNVQSVDNLVSGSQLENFTINKNKLSLELQNEISNSEIQINSHLLDSDSHVSKDEKDRWNNVTKTDPIEEVLNRGENIIDAEHDSMVDIVGIEGTTIVNYAPLFDSGKWVKHSISAVDYIIKSSNKIEAVIDAQSKGIFLCSVNLKPNINYTLSVEHNGTICVTTSSHNEIITNNGTYSNDKTISFISPNDGIVNVFFRTGKLINSSPDEIENGIFYFQNVMLNEGSNALPFVANIKGINNPTIEIVGEENKSSSMTLLTTLYDGDRIYQENGNIVADKSIREIILGKNEVWSHRENRVGFKFVQSPLNASFEELGGALGVKYNGMIIPVDRSSLLENSTFPTSLNHIIISVPNNDSGWGDSYTPTPDEIKAYFLGWRMYTDIQGNPFDGSGGKYWAKIYCGVGAKDASFGGSGIVSGSGINTLPTVKNEGYSYRLIYKLDNPVKEHVRTVGSLSLTKGVNHVNASEGKIVRERAHPANGESVGAIGSFLINYNFANIDSRLKNKVDKFINVYKNGVIDDNWVSNTSHGKYGNFYLEITRDKFDQTAVYEVDYIPLEPYKVSAPTNPITIEFQPNLGSVVNKLIKDSTNIESRTSDIERTMIRKDEPLQWINATTLHMTKGHIRYAKDSFGFVHLRMVIDDILWTNGAVIGILPKNYRPVFTISLVGALHNVNPFNGDVPFSIYDDGSIVLRHGMSVSGQNIVTGSISGYTIFKAEQ